MAKKPNVPAHIVDAALDLAGDRGWNALSLADIAAQAKVSLAELYEQFPSKSAILSAYVHSLDEAVMAGDTPDFEDSPRDRLFEVVMRRFDAMKPRRQALGRVLRDAGTDPVVVLCGMRRFKRSMALMLEAAGISTSGLSGMARVEGLTAVYLGTLRVWLKDDTADQARTMAALDKALRRAETLAGLVWCRPRRRDAAPPPAESAGEVAAP